MFIHREFTLRKTKRLLYFVMNMEIEESQSGTLIESVGERDIVVELLERPFLSRTELSRKRLLVSRYPHRSFPLRETLETRILVF